MLCRLRGNSLNIAATFEAWAPLLIKAERKPASDELALSEEPGSQRA